MSGSRAVEFNDDSMLEVFRAEVETHVETLTSGLLALEKSPESLPRVDEMMRAAHSIKGAARIVGVDAAVRVSHALEDFFVAVRDGRRILSSADVDVLLNGVDLLTKVSTPPGADSRQPTVGLAPAVEEAERAIREALTNPPRPAAASESDAPHAPHFTFDPSAGESLLSFPGDITPPAAEAARVAIVQVWNDLKLLTLDFSRVRDVSPTGLLLLALLAKEANRRDARLRLVLERAAPEIVRLLRLVGLADAFEFSAGGK